ncbi:MAG: hypothetical protein O7G86_17680, partial [Gammaproteobacteria bacterium]|nr:hypothetical protein [Gammaproteobacteria bacterium]
MKATQLRSQHDKEMFDRLLEDPFIKKVNEQIAKREGKGNLGIRRHLLSTSVRLTQTMAAPLHKIAAECADKLGLTIPL